MSAHAAPKAIIKNFNFWQDREIRFDASRDALRLRPGVEQVLATIHHVEDTKGNNGQAGTLLVTNLRLIWWSSRHRSVNLSIGYYCIHGVKLQETNSKLQGGTAEALFISAKVGTSRFQFVFNAVSRVGASTSAASAGKAKLFESVRSVWRAYDGSRAARELRVRSAVVEDGNVVVLPGEHVLSMVKGVNNVSKDQGYVGTFVVTNLRVVWFAASSGSFNVSIPFMQFTALRSQQSSFGPALVIQTSAYAGNFVLGFRVDPPERLVQLYQEVASLWRAWSARPLLGMQVKLGDGGAHDGSAADEDEKASSVAHTVEDGLNVVEEAPNDAFAAYYADEGQRGADRRPVYNKDIGLAVEKLRSGVRLQDLWSVTPSS